MDKTSIIVRHSDELMTATPDVKRAVRHMLLGRFGHGKEQGLTPSAQADATITELRDEVRALKKAALTNSQTIAELKAATSRAYWDLCRHSIISDEAEN